MGEPREIVFFVSISEQKGVWKMSFCTWKLHFLGLRVSFQGCSGWWEIYKVGLNFPFGTNQSPLFCFWLEPKQSQIHQKNIPPLFHGGRFDHIWPNPWQANMWSWFPRPKSRNMGTNLRNLGILTGFPTVVLGAVLLSASDSWEEKHISGVSKLFFAFPQWYSQKSAMAVAVSRQLVCSCLFLYRCIPILIRYLCTHVYIYNSFFLKKQFLHFTSEFFKLFSALLQEWRRSYATWKPWWRPCARSWRTRGPQAEGDTGYIVSPKKGEKPWNLS